MQRQLLCLDYGAHAEIAVLRPRLRWHEHLNLGMSTSIPAQGVATVCYISTSREQRNIAQRCASELQIFKSYNLVLPFPPSCKITVHASCLLGTESFVNLSSQLDCDILFLRYPGPKTILFIFVSIFGNHCVFCVVRSEIFGGLHCLENSPGQLTCWGTKYKPGRIKTKQQHLVLCCVNYYPEKFECGTRAKLGRATLCHQSLSGH